MISWYFYLGIFFLLLALYYLSQSARENFTGYMDYSLPSSIKPTMTYPGVWKETKLKCSDHLVDPHDSLRPEESIPESTKCSPKPNSQPRQNSNMSSDGQPWYPFINDMVEPKPNFSNMNQPSFPVNALPNKNPSRPNSSVPLPNPSQPSFPVNALPNKNPSRPNSSVPLPNPSQPSNQSSVVYELPLTPSGNELPIIPNLFRKNTINDPPVMFYPQQNEVLPSGSTYPGPCRPLFPQMQTPFQQEMLKPPTPAPIILTSQVEMKPPIGAELEELRQSMLSNLTKLEAIRSQPAAQTQPTVTQINIYDYPESNKSVPRINVLDRLIGTNTTTPNNIATVSNNVPTTSNNVSTTSNNVAAEIGTTPNNVTAPVTIRMPFLNNAQAPSSSPPATGQVVSTIPTI